MNKLLRLNAEFLAVLAGSIVAGFTIGVLQHYVSFGAWGYGFSRESFELALLEGGIVGGMFAIPTGLITYYVILKRDLTVL
jgi:hypothetical protein